MGKKKPTMNEMKNVVTNLIMHVNTIDKHLQKMDTAVFNYIKFKGDEEGYIEYMTKITKEKSDEISGKSNKGNRRTKNEAKDTRNEVSKDDSGVK
tara:strand:+ start:1589 stop:1873 length:285 start_codon:yes stop_codon:yes gene_type:complete